MTQLTHHEGQCAGKDTVLEYLVTRHNFTPVYCEPPVRVNPASGKSSHGHMLPRLKKGQISFSGTQALVEYVLQHWETDFVTTAIYDSSLLDALAHRPLFILIHVDAPLSIRYAHLKTTSIEDSKLSLEEFVDKNDQQWYDPITKLASVASHAHVKVLNTAPSISTLYSHLEKLNLPDATRIRPTWDTYFMTLASLAARRSNCMRRQVGCILTLSNRIISTGYNGTPRHLDNCNAGGCPRCNNPSATGAGGVSLSTCLCIHAEENALLEAGRERVGQGAVLYCNTCPCLTCSIKIVQVGITEVVFSRSYYMDAAAAEIFTKAGVKLRQFEVPAEGLVDLGGEVAGGGAGVESALSWPEAELARARSLKRPNGDAVPGGKPKRVRTTNGHEVNGDERSDRHDLESIVTVL